MSFNSSIQQLGTSAASLIAGIVVIKGEHGEIFRYEWLGYLSVIVLLSCVIIGNRIFRRIDVSALQVEKEKIEEAAVLSS